MIRLQAPQDPAQEVPLRHPADTDSPVGHCAVDCVGKRVKNGISGIFSIKKYGISGVFLALKNGISGIFDIKKYGISGFLQKISVSIRFLQFRCNKISFSAFLMQTYVKPN